MNIFARLLQLIGLKRKPAPAYPPGQEDIWDNARGYAEAVFGRNVPRIGGWAHVRCTRQNNGRWVYTGVSGHDVRGEYFPTPRIIKIAVGPDGKPGKDYSTAVYHEFGEHANWTLHGKLQHSPEFAPFYEGWV